VFFNQVEHHLVGGQIAFIRHFLHYGAVCLFIFIKMRVADIKYGIFAQAAGLMHLKVETDMNH